MKWVGPHLERQVILEGKKIHCPEFIKFTFSISMAADAENVFEIINLLT